MVIVELSGAKFAKQITIVNERSSFSFEEGNKIIKLIM